MENWSPRRKLVFIITSVTVVLAMLILIIFFAIPNSTNPYGEELKIENFSGLVKNLPTERRDAIFSALHTIVTLNGINEEQASTINDAVIRTDSAKQSYDVKNDIYNGEFIVDIESIKQSYLVRYFYAAKDSVAKIGGYSLLMLCLPVDQLKYGDFNCKETLAAESEGIDPIIQYLPHSTLSYQINSRTGDDGKVTLTIQLLLTEADRRTGEQAAVDIYKSEALDWIRSKGLDPNNYTINYTY
jgi:hypothetical protein